MNETLFSSKKGKEKEGANGSMPSGRRVPKGRKRVAYKKFVIGLAFLGLYVTQGGTFNFGVSMENWFLQKSLLYR